MELVSADGHIEVAPEVWTARVAPEWRESAPVSAPVTGGGDGILFPGMAGPLPLGEYLRCGRPAAEIGTPIRFMDELPGTGDPRSRLKEMDADGVRGEVLFPSASWQILQSQVASLPAPARRALARAYNDWLSEDYTAEDRARLHGIATLPNTTVDENIEELERAATLPGICGVVLFEWPSGRGYPMPSDARFWRAAADLGFPIAVHESLGLLAPGEALRPEEERRRTSLLARTGGRSGYSAMQLILEGVFDVHPGLRIHLAEAGAGWLPHFAFQADDNYARHRHRARLHLDRAPSDYLRDNFLWGFQNDRLALRDEDVVGPDNTCWGSDFPHSASDWPSSRELLAGILGEGERESVAKVVRDNAIRFYSLSA